MVPGPCSHPGAAGLQSYGAWVDWEVCVVEKGASLAAQLLAMLTAKTVHCCCGAALILCCVYDIHGPALLGLQKVCSSADVCRHLSLFVFGIKVV